MLKPTRTHAAYQAFFFVVATFFAFVDSGANSRMGHAEVRELDGRPCFSIPSDAETRNGIPLSTIYVSENKTREAGTLPKEVWHVAILPPGGSITIAPNDCIPYGQALPGAQQRTFVELEPLRVYAVHLGARPEDTNLIGYDARFCLVPTADGKFSVKASTRDDLRGTKTLQGCRDL